MIKPKMTKESVRKIFDKMADILVKKNEDYKGASFDLVYTRNEKGRKVLMEARMKTIANAKSKTRSYKKVKGF